MILNFNAELASEYHSNSQRARVLTESWVEENMYCPRCGSSRIDHCANNSPVADFRCPVCECEYELKSKKGSLPAKVIDGAYDTMIERITSRNNPDFLFMSYDGEFLKVKDLILIPKHFFVPDIIEKRKPLPEKARRAGWIGCNILIDKVPEQGRISIIKNGVVSDSLSVIEKTKSSRSFEMKNISARGWLMDILNCLNLIPNVEFSLSDMYAFESVLEEKHPKNSNIKPKIRQQLQFLRDKGVIEFMGNGRYRKLM